MPEKGKQQFILLTFKQPLENNYDDVFHLLAKIKKSLPAAKQSFKGIWKTSFLLNPISTVLRIVIGIFLILHILNIINIIYKLFG